MCVLEGSDAMSGGAGRSAPSAGADTMIEEEEMTQQCGDRKRWPGDFYSTCFAA